MTVRMPCGGGIYGGQTHSQSPEAMFTQVCGLRTVMPSNPYDAKGLLIACIENDDPVIFLEPKRLYNGPFDGHHDRPVTPWSKHPASQVPDGYYKVPLDKAAIDHRVGQRQAALLGDLAEELQARLDVLLVAAVGDGRGEHPIDRLGGSADVADGDLVLALQQVGPAVRYVLHQLFVDDEGDGPGVGERPVAVLVFGPGRDLFPGARLVRLADALLHGDGAEGGADVADVGAGVVLLGLELGQLLGRTHVGIHVLEPILALKVLPGVLPVRPAVGHADAVDLAFLARGLFQRLQVRFGGQRQAAAEGDGGSQQ